jgi:acetyl/propionyl-CoA carboxylase alpha subunit
MALTKLAIANRGEVAVRIIRAAQEMGIETLLLHSEADANSLPARLVDERICIGPAEVSASYLNISVNIESALSRGADAIHPGFGFLSENAEFAESCLARGLIFVGPSPEAIRLFGDKISAKHLVEKAGGPTVPGYDGNDQTPARLEQEADRIGYPVMVKATAGGGGRGLRVIRNRGAARSEIEAAQREGKLAFGSAKVFLEKYIEGAKHIEVQIFGDASGKIFALGERECSVQRRHQKIIEEAPAAQLPPALKEKLVKVAIDVGQAAGYVGAGTVEFLVTGNEFYFMEMNTRLQVEHPVTEMVYGVDLVKAQLLTAQGKPLGWGELVPRGHAVECRLLAEDPYNNGLPSTGRISTAAWPIGPGRRFDAGVESGDVVSTHYDPMIAKIIVVDESRTKAIQKMKRTLSETIMFGVRTNIPLLQEILRQPEFVLGTMSTDFFAKHFSQGLPPTDLDSDGKLVLNLLRQQLSNVSETTTEGSDPWMHGWERK